MFLSGWVHRRCCAGVAPVWEAYVGTMNETSASNTSDTSAGDGETRRAWF